MDKKRILKIHLSFWMKEEQYSTFLKWKSMSTANTLNDWPYSPFLCEKEGVVFGAPTTISNCAVSNKASCFVVVVLLLLWSFHTCILFTISPTDLN